MSNDKIIWDKLIAVGLTPAGAAGLLGNLYAESGLEPTNLQNAYEAKLGFTDADYTAAVDCGAHDAFDFIHDGAGYGIAQWTHFTRKATLLAQAKEAGRSVGDLEVQLTHLFWELSALFAGVWDKLCTTSSVREASDCVLLQFERPANQSEENCARRTEISQEFYDRFTGGDTMNFIMTASVLCATALDIARNYLTSYMLGPWGWPANDTMIARTTTSGSNAQTNKKWLAYANAIKGKGFLFDCVGLIKGILWGWCGDLSRTYGGAGYACNGVPDYGADTMIAKCSDVSTDFSTIVPGEVVWMSGHIGIYVGGGVVVESTPKWNWGVQESTCLNVAGKQLPGTVGSRTWTKHGRLPWVDYSAAKEIDEEDDDMLSYEQWKEYMDRYRKELAALPVSQGELAAAKAVGITDGKRPREFATREEAAVMVLRGMQRAE